MNHSNYEDSLQRFVFDKTHIRGEIVHLNQSLKSIIEQHAYPEAIHQLLSETLLAAVLLTATIKFNGQLTIQFQSEGAIKLLVAKCNDQLNIRGLAQFTQDALQAEIIKTLGEGQLVVTIEPDKQVRPYQSIIPIRNYSIAESLEYYFMQSEQLPTRIRLAVTKDHAVGMLLQLLPSKQTDYQFAQYADQICEQLSENELLTLDNEEILNKLYEEQDVRVFALEPITFKCSCTINRMKNAIQLIGEQEANDILHDKQSIVVTCEYCNYEYSFSRHEVADIFNSEEG